MSTSEPSTSELVADLRRLVDLGHVKGGGAEAILEDAAFRLEALTRADGDAQSPREAAEHIVYGWLTDGDEIGYGLPSVDDLIDRIAKAELAARWESQLVEPEAPR